jgi:hypothetical protein
MMGLLPVMSFGGPTVHPQEHSFFETSTTANSTVITLSILQVLKASYSSKQTTGETVMNCGLRKAQRRQLKCLRIFGQVRITQIQVALKMSMERFFFMQMTHHMDIKFGNPKAI